MPSPVRARVSQSESNTGRSRSQSLQSPKVTALQPGGWSDDVEAHEARILSLRKARTAKASEPSSEDTGRRTSPEQSATSMSTASALVSIHDLDLLDRKRANRHLDDDAAEAPDRVPQLPQLSETYYKHPRYSRRVQSKSEPSSNSHESEADEVACPQLDTAPVGESSVSEMDQIPEGCY